MYSHESEYATDEAREYVNRLSPELLADLGPLAIVIRALHEGSNAFGHRLTEPERAVLLRTKDHLQRKVRDKYLEGKPDYEFRFFMERHGLDRIDIRAAFAEKMNKGAQNPASS